MLETQVRVPAAKSCSSSVTSLPSDSFPFYLSNCRRTHSRTLGFLVSALILLSCLAAGADKPQSFALPLTFEPNRGQVNQKAAFLSRSSGALFTFGDSSFSALLADGSNLRVRFQGARENTPAIGEVKTGGVSNYYLDADRSKWLEGIPNFRQLRYTELYSGIDAVFHGRQGRLEYDFEVKPGASPDQIKFVFDPDVVLELSKQGALLVKSGDQVISFLAPEVYQEVSNARVAIEGKYCFTDKHTIAFSIGAYDHAKLLTIDPVVVYTRLIASLQPATANSAAVDSSGNLYITGEAPVHMVNADFLHVTKLDPTGENMLFFTQVRGGVGDHIVLDSSGAAYIAGLATEADFPLTSQSMGACSQTCYSGFVAKFNSNGHLLYSTLLGGGYNRPLALSAAPNGKILVAGVGDRTLPTVNAFQPFFNCTFCNGAPYFARLNESGTAFDFASFFGESGQTTGIATDTAGNIFITGTGGVPLINPLFDGTGIMFVAKFSADGQTLLSSTNFGGSADLSSQKIAVLSNGSACLAGHSLSQNFPYSLNAFRLPAIAWSSASYSWRMFAACFSPDLSTLKYSTYLGIGQVNALGVDAADNLYMAGAFDPEPLPLKNAVVSDTTHGGFVLALDKEGALALGTQYGTESVVQVPTALAVTPAGEVYIAGQIQGILDQAMLDELPGPVNVGTGVAYNRQQELSFPSYFAAKIAPNNLPQISLSFMEPFLVLRNAGSADLHISSVTGKDATGGNCTSILPASTSCILHSTASTVTITSDAQPGTQSFSPIDSAGTIHIPVLVEPHRLFFPPQQVNTTSPSQSVKVTNVQSIPQSITSIQASGDLYQTNDCPATLNPSASCSISVSYTPTGDVTWTNVTISVPELSSPINVRTAFSSTPGPIFLSSSQLLFGNVPVGKSSQNLAINVFNSSNSSVSLPVASVTPSTFSITGTTCSGPLPAHRGCAFSVQFTPTENGAVEGTVNVSAGTGTASANLYATGKISSSVSVYPLRLPLYYPVLGLATFSNRLELTNNAPNPVTVTGIGFGLPDYQQTNTCQGPIPSGGKCDIDVTITPQELGDRSSILKIDFDSAASQLVPLNASVKYPLAVSTSAVDFGSSTPVGVVSNPSFLGFSSNAQSGIQVRYSAAVSGPFEIVQDACAGQIPSYSSCGILLAFHPLVAGPQQGALTFSYPGVTQQTIVALIGDTSSPGVLISPLNVDFFGIHANSVSPPYSVTLRNPMNFAVSVPQPVLGGPAANLFQVTDLCDTIQPGATCQPKITFAPSKGGSFSATLTFQNGGTPPTPISVAISGTAVDVPGFEIQWVDAFFGNLDIGQTSRPIQLTIYNRGPLPLALPQLRLSGDQAGDFVGTPDTSCNMVAPNATCTVKILFAPKALGQRNALLSFDSRSTDGHSEQVALTGRGTEFKFSSSNVTSKTITAGQVATFELQLEASVASYGYIDLSCTANGANYGTCRPQGSVYLDTNTAKATISISPAGSGSATVQRPRWSYSSLFFAVSIPFAVIFAIQRRSSGIFATLALVGTFLVLTSCGGGSGSGGVTPPPSRSSTTYTYTVTATNSAQVSHTTLLTVTVNSN